ncbi:hypothetical protein Ancab_008289 [Ancistrocladus abbreviatus]
MNMRFTEDAKQNPVQIPKSRTNGWQASWKKFLIDMMNYLPNGKLPPASKLPSLNLFNQAVSLKGLKAAGAKLGQDVLQCNVGEMVAVDHNTGLPTHCAKF